MEEIDRKILRHIQDGIPIVKRPYRKIADELDMAEERVINRLKDMLEDNLVKRFGCVPHHYNLGFTANGMSVWDIPDGEVDSIGEKFGEFDFVTHCYRRPRHLPVWPYNLFAMVHGKSKEQVEKKVSQLESTVKLDDVTFEIIYSTELLKKKGSRLS